MIEIPERVKDSLRDGRMLKNYRFNVLDDQGEVDFTIDNEFLVSESVKFDERMCSGSLIKFGLCEGSSLEFQYFNKPNINKRQLQTFVDVQYKDGDGDLAWYSIPMGFFTVAQCPMQFETGIRKVTAYNKLQSDYLDAKANDLLQNMFENKTTSVMLYDVKRLLLQDYEINQEETEMVTPVNMMFVGVSYTPGTKFNNKANYKSPLNSYYLVRVEKAWNSTFYPLYRSFARRWRIDPEKAYRLESFFDLTTWESQFVAYLTDLIDKSDMTITGATYINQLFSGKDPGSNETVGWGKVFSIVATKNGVKEVYSSYAYTHNNSGIAGGFEDILNRTLIGYSYVEFYMPWYMVLLVTTPPSLDLGTTCNAEFTGPIYGYYYYNDDGTVSERPYNTPHFPNGDEIPLIDHFPPYDIPTDDYITLKRILTPIDEADLIEISADTELEFTLRDILTATYETVCQYGKLDRITDLFSGEELNTGGLYPRDDLYPADDLYPGGNMDKAIKSAYSKLWTDTVGEQTFRNLIIKYKGLDENQQEKEFELQRTVNANGTTDYYMTDNWLFKNLVWTAEQVGDYADAMVEKMQGIKWFPFELWGAGLPYLETGDEIEIDTQDGSYTSYILQRQLSGIQNLQDTFINGELDIF